MYRFLYMLDRVKVALQYFIPLLSFFAVNRKKYYKHRFIYFVRMMCLFKIYKLLSHIGKYNKYIFYLTLCGLWEEESLDIQP